MVIYSGKAALIVPCLRTIVLSLSAPIGTLELWNSKYNRIWFTDSACASVTKCAGASSLALKDGDFKLYRSLDDHLSSYWSARASN